MVITVLFVEAPGSTSSNITLGTAAAACAMVLIFSLSLPSEMFGTHSIIFFIMLK